MDLDEEELLLAVASPRVRLAFITWARERSRKRPRPAKQHPRDEAIALLLQLRERCPDDRDVLVALGDIYHSAKKHHEANDCYQIVFNGFKNQAQAANRLGKTCLRQGRYAEAKDWFKLVLSVHENEREAHIGLCLVLQALHRQGSNPQHLDELIQLQEQFLARAEHGHAEDFAHLAGSLWTRAAISDEDGSFATRAEQAFQSALAINKDCVEAYCAKARHEHLQGHFELAEQTYERALACARRASKISEIQVRLIECRACVLSGDLERRDIVIDSYAELLAAFRQLEPALRALLVGVGLEVTPGTGGRELIRLATATDGWNLTGPVVSPRLVEYFGIARREMFEHLCLRVWRTRNHLTHQGLTRAGRAIAREIVIDAALAVQLVSIIKGIPRTPMPLSDR